MIVLSFVGEQTSLHVRRPDWVLIFSSSHSTFTLPENVEDYNGLVCEQAKYAALPITTMHASTALAIDVLRSPEHALDVRSLIRHRCRPFSRWALLDCISFSLQLSESVMVKVTSYGMPRVGNQAFANFVDSQLSGRVTHVNPGGPLPGRA